MGNDFSGILEYLSNRKGRVLGLILGILAGFAVMKYGFWKTLFLAICAGLGYFVGKRLDERRGFDDIIARIWPYRDRRRR